MYDLYCGDLIIPKIRCCFNVNTAIYYIFCLIIQAFASVLLVGKLSYEVDKNLDKEKIAEIAIEHYDLVKEYIDAVEKHEANT